MADHQDFQSPPQPPARQLRPGFRALLMSWLHTCPHTHTGIGAPSPAVCALPAERLVGQLAGDHVARGTPPPTAPVRPLIGFDDPAGQDRPLRLEALADGPPDGARPNESTQSGRGTAKVA
jgi:hypothetical protein